MLELRRENFESIAFDLDGTLVDSDSAHLTARLMAYEKIAEKHSQPRLKSISPRIHAEAHHHGSDPISINGWVLEEAGIQIDDRDILQEIVALKRIKYAELALGGLPPVRGAVGTVKHALRYWGPQTMIVTTAGLEEEVRPFLHAQKIAADFSDRQLVTRADVKNLKPDPEAYIVALGRVGLEQSPGKLLVIEDTPFGVAAANAAGATTVGILTPDYGDKLKEQTGTAKPDYIVEDFTILTRTLGLLDE